MTTCVSVFHRSGRLLRSALLCIGLVGIGPTSLGAVQWPDEWVFFGSLARNYPDTEASFFKSIPEVLPIPETGPLPALTLEPRRIAVVPGETLDLAPYLDSERVGTGGYLFIPLRASAVMDVTLGMGADWWLACFLNGEPVYDTLAAGNDAFPPSVLNHQVEVRLREGENLLVVRVMRGAASAFVAVGDQSHFAAAQARSAARRERRGLNTLPETLAERLLFPQDEMATTSAGWTIDLSLPDADPATGALMGLQPMPQRQVYFNQPAGTRAEMRDTEEPRFDDPVTLLLSKSVYPSEDRHLDAILWTTPPEDGALSGEVELLLKNAQGDVLAQHTLAECSPTGWFFSIGFPPELVGGTGELEAIWRTDAGEQGRAVAAFQVAAPEAVVTSGRIPLQVHNAPGAILPSAPMTLGVPFPRGALHDASSLRLVDAQGTELPLQTRISARWSRFGSIKWLLCDFTVDLTGEPREVFLEFAPPHAVAAALRADSVGDTAHRAGLQDAAHRAGLQDAAHRAASPAVDGRRWASMSVDSSHIGFPVIDAGRLRFGPDGLWLDAAGNGEFTRVLDGAALSGAFVTHEDGRLFRPDPATPFVIEEAGSEKLVVRRTGWYVGSEQLAVGSGPLAGPTRHPTPDSRFCQYVTRYVIHRGSPILRVFHTWIFTGDGNRDRIAEMGWRFPTAQPVADGAFRVSHETGEWLAGSNLVQHDYDAFSLPDVAPPREGRTPGMLRLAAGAQAVFFGVKDFWQNFPSELEIEADAFTFYNWPRHNPPARFERPVQPADAFRHRFAHEGEVLDFRLPEEYTEGPIWQEACSRERHWERGRPETANAQGIARTEEFFLYLGDAATSDEAAARVIRGLNDESIRATADPAWVAASGVFGEIHPRDLERYPEDEQLYTQVVRAPARWNDRLGFYGMWLFGDVPAWGINLENRSVALYRAIRKNHHGWPVAWIPFARSGDPEMLKHAEAPTRQMIDANFCHYADEAVDQSVGPDYFRRQGWWDRSLLPWAARRGPHLRTYTVDSDYLWHAYYLTGYTRARDVALLFGRLTQQDHGAPRGPRTTSSMLPSYLDLYQATWDPWFLQAAHVIAQLHLSLYSQEAQLDPFTHQSPGHFWRPADEYFHRFTGDPNYRLLALNHSIGYSSPRSYAFGGLWSRLSVPYISQAVHAWRLTGNPFHLDRADAYLDWARRGVYDGEVEHYRGTLVQGGTALGIFTGYYIRQFPLALGAFERAGYQPQTVANPFFVSGSRVPGEDPDLFHFQLPEVIVRKSGNQVIDLSLAPRHRDDTQPYYYEIIAPDGTPFLSGEYLLDFRPRTVDIPAEAPDGDYRVKLGGRVPLSGAYADRSRIMRRHGDILLPLARRDVPEVMRFTRTEEGTRVTGGTPEVQYTFRVPEGATTFWIAFDGGGLNRYSVWNPDGERVWDASLAGESPERAVLHVPDGQAGRLWRATGGAFRIDPQIPPYFSVNAAQWFDPQAE